MSNACIPTVRALCSAALASVLATAPLVAQAPPATGTSAAQAPQAPAQAGALQYTLDPAHTKALFKVKHFGVSNVTGHFDRVAGSLVYDASAPQSSTVTATIDATSLDSDNDQRDADIKGGNYLDVANHPQITFVSTKVETAGPSRLRVTGDLTIKGVTKPVVLDTELLGTFTPPGRGPIRAFQATTTISRREFGLTFNRLLEGVAVVGDEVTITIEVEARAAAPPS